MKWLLKRLSIVCLIMGILCAAAVVVGRLDHSPTKLQLYGLDVCDGDPCIMSLKPNMDLLTVMKMFPEGVLNQAYFVIPLKMTGLKQIGILPSIDYKTVDVISIEPVLTVSDVINKYGAPCRVFVQYSVSTPMVRFALYYPMMSLDSDTQSVNDSFNLNFSSQIRDISIFPDTIMDDTCNRTTTEFFGPWHGFISSEAYHQHNLRDIAVAQTIVPNP